MSTVTNLQAIRTDLTTALARIEYLIQEAIKAEAQQQTSDNVKTSPCTEAIELMIQQHG